MGADAVTTDDLRDLRDTLLAEMRAGFSGVHHRQDVANGRLGKGETTAARHDERINALEDQSPVTRREFWAGVAVLSAAGGVILWVLEVVGQLRP